MSSSEHVTPIGKALAHSDQASTPASSEAKSLQLSTDRPIELPSQDRLNRKSFAHAMAAAVSGWRGQDSLVLALYGAWGVGKSSIKNLVKAALTKGDEPSVLVVEFNPWRFANREQLTEAFFDQIGVAIGRGTVGSLHKRNALLNRWRRYAASLTSVRNVVSFLQKPGSALTAISGALIVLLSAERLRALGLVVGSLLLVLAAALHLSSTVANAVAGVLEVGVEVGRRSLEEIRDDLSKDLKELSAPLLVVLDDVDRLTPAETLEMLQLIKANADFPNLVYLLLGDRSVLQSHIEAELGAPGREYLDKIVQVAFDVPVLERSQLRNVLFEGLDRLLLDEPTSKRFDHVRWGNLYFGVLDPYFDTLRAVNRFLSSLSFHIAVFRNADTFEVNPVDLIGLEVIRLCDNDVYRAIASSKEVLTGERLELSGVDSTKRKDAITNIVDIAPQEHRERIGTLIQQLFPRAAWALGGMNYAHTFGEKWYRDLRVASEDIFDRYFSLTIPSGDVSQAVIDRILASTGDRIALRRQLQALAEQDLLHVALDRLEAYKEMINLEHSESFVGALFDVGDVLPVGTSDFFGSSPDVHAWRIVLWHLRRDPDPDHRLEVLSNAIKTSVGLALAVRYVSLEKGREGRDGEKGTVTAEGLEVLKKLCVQRISDAASASTLSTNSRLLYILYRWQEWEGSEPVKAYCAKLVSEPLGALTFLRALTRKSTSMGMEDYVVREKWFIKLRNIEEFVSTEALRAQLPDIDPLANSPEDKRAIEAFRSAFQRRKEGRPDAGDSDYADDDDE